MFDNFILSRRQELIGLNIYYFLALFGILFSTSGFCQPIVELQEKITTNFNQKNYYTALNLCKQVIKTCETTPEPECWYTNIMKDIYRYKGIAEFEIYKTELQPKRLSEAIESLTYSYNLFKDPDVQFLMGYLQSLNAILIGNKNDLNGLVTAWESLLSLYARNGWQVSADLVDKIKLFIRVAEKYTEPIPKTVYSGAFARFIIVMACDLAEKGDMPETDKNYFEETRLKYCRDEGIQWEKWRSNSMPPK